MKNTIYQMLILILLVASTAWSQESEMTNKDLEVAENIFYTLVKQDLESDFWFSDDRIQAEFVKGYGVVFNINYNYSTLIRWTRPAIYTLKGELADLRKAKDLSKEGKEMNRSEEEDDENAEVDAEITDSGEYVIPGKLSDEEYQEVFVEAAKNYLADYASLLKGLNKEHKVTFKIGTQFNNFDNFFVGVGKSRGRSLGYTYAIQSDEKGHQPVIISGTGFDDEDRRHLKSGVTITATKSAIDKLANQEISRNKFIDMLEIVKIQATDEDNPQFEIFATVMERLYERDLSETYYMASSPLNYERYENLGIVYYMRVYSSNISGKLYYMPTIGKKDLEKAERNAEVEKLYPKFVDGLKDNILEYGIMIKDMPDEESIIFKVKLTECSGCDMPDKIELKIQKSVINDYQAKRISADKAKNTFELSEFNN